ncbi:MAG: ketopantoate reductase family protein [Proteobacteria bacterium]|nr:ketopantoate reductase family protein [Pseudomonadota bacterium]
MKTLIYGAGPIGQWLALKLEKAGTDVTLLARGQTYEALEQDGIRIRDALTGEQVRAQVKLTKALGSQDRYDLVVVPMVKSSRLAVCPTLAENMHIEHFLFLGNEVAGADEYFTHLPKEKVLLGFPGAGGGHKDGELIIAEGDKPGGKGKIFIGELDGKPRSRTRQIKKLLEDSCIAVSIEKDIDGWLKYHFAFIGPTAGVIYKFDGDMKAVASDAEAIHQYCQACREAGDVLRKIGYKKRQPAIFNLYYWLPRWLEPKALANLFGSDEAEVKFGLHAGVVGPELLGLAEEFEVLKRKANMDTPNLDALIDCVRKAQPAGEAKEVAS